VDRRVALLAMVCQCPPMRTPIVLVLVAIDAKTSGRATDDDTINSRTSVGDDDDAHDDCLCDA